MPVPDGFDATADEYRDWLIGVLEAIGEPVDLVGHDWGGGHVQRVATARPDLIRSWCTDIIGAADPDYEWHDLAKVWQTPGEGEALVEAMASMPKADRIQTFVGLGMTPEAAGRELRAETTGNGVTGFVAATGKSYLCEDTSEDPLYLEGAKGARSSLTVPVMLHDTVTGTLNVESPEPRAFSESDLQFLEIFARDVAIALNTLELLAAEKASTAAASVEAIHSAVALPVDDITKKLIIAWLGSLVGNTIAPVPSVE